MKRVLLLLLLCSSMLIKAQGINLSIFQDVKLAVMEDDYGNKPFTPDVRLEFTVDGKEKWDLGYLTLGGTYEYADLYGGKYQRYGIQGGFTFMYMRLFNWFEYKMTPMIGVGVINRLNDSSGYKSFEASVDFDYQINNWLSTSVKPTLTQRGDLYAKYKDVSGLSNPIKWKPNIYIGLKFNIATGTKSNKTAGKAACNKRKRKRY